MYYARVRPLHCAGCGRSLAAAAARCPYCGVHVRYSHAADGRRAPIAYPGPVASHSLNKGEANESA